MSDYLSLRTRCTSILSSSSTLSNIPGSQPGAPGAAHDEAHADLPDMGGCPLAIGARIWQEAAGTAESERCVWACLDRVQIDAEGESDVRASARVVPQRARTRPLRAACARPSPIWFRDATSAARTTAPEPLSHAPTVAADKTTRDPRTRTIGPERGPPCRPPDHLGAVPCGTGRKATPAAAMATPPARYSRRDIAARGVQASHTSQSQSHSHSFRLRGHRHGFLARPRGVRRNGYGSIEHAVWRLRAQVMPSPSMPSVQCMCRQTDAIRPPSVWVHCACPSRGPDLGSSAPCMGPDLLAPSPISPCLSAVGDSAADSMHAYR